MPTLVGRNSHAAAEKHHAFSLDLDPNGSQRLVFLLYGDTTRVTITSTWASPSFFGSYLPANRTIDDDGFKAEWRVSSIGRPLPHSCREFFGNPPTFAGGNHNPPSLSLLGCPDKSRLRFSTLNTYNVHTS